jgi:TonB family protein
MEHKSSNFRLFNCFSASVLFHSLLIVGMGVASSMMMLKKGDGDGEGKTIEVSVVGEQVPLEMAPAPVVVEAPAPAPIVQQPIAAPVVVQQPVVAKKAIAKKPAIKQEVKAEPVVEVNETMNESPVVVQDSDSNQIKQDEINKENQALPEKVEEVKAEETKEEVQPVAAAAQETKVEEQKQEVAKEEEKKQEVAPAAAAQTADAGKTEKAGGDGGTAAQSSPIATQAAPQNFLNLKQTSGNKPPQYSRDMRFNRLEGRGQLEYYVTKSGTVSKLKVTQSSGHADLDKAAAEAFSKYKFVPGQEGYTVHNFEFTLKGPAEADAGRLRTTYK